MASWTDVSTWVAPALDDEQLKHLATKRCPACGREFEGLFIQCPSDQMMLQDVPPPSGILANRYQCGRKIGAGSLFDVYEATDRQGEQAAVVKVLRGEFEGDPQPLKRFEQEQMIAAALRHRNIAPPLAFGALPQQYSLRPFVVSERIDGVALATALAQWGGCDLAVAVRLMSQICDAFEHAHQLGAVHSDFKPSNVFLTAVDEKPVIRVVDFAVSRRAFAGRGSGAGLSTQSISSALYTAPEVSRGAVPTAQADIYAIGCVFYELLAGHPPFEGRSAFELAFQHEREEPAPLAAGQGEAALRDAVMHCLVKDPSSRLVQLTELKAALGVPA